MFNSSKNSDNIKNFYINSETGQPVNKSVSNLDFKSLCEPDVEWVFNKCMKYSKTYREALDKKFKVKVDYDPIAKHIPHEYEYLKKTTMASYDNPRLPPADIMGNAFLTCSSLYYQHCKNFHEKKQLESGLQLEPINFSDLA
jgi:hypothetical protein